MNNVEKDIVIDYTENNLSLEFLYRRYRCPKIEIVEILQRNNIKIKDYFILEKEVLKDLYIEQNKTIADIANYYKQPVRNIKRLLVYYDINKSPEEVKQARLEKIKSSNLEKYGFEYPYQSKKIREKSTLTTLSRYGVDNPFKLEEFKEKIKKTNLDKYGVEYNTQREEVKKKLSDYMKNNPKLHNRKDVTDYGKKYIDNFEMYLDSIVENGELTISTKEISIMFGVAENTIINKIKKYNSSLIKAKPISSWEEPIKNLLEKNNIKYIRNYRKLSKGKYEIDFFLPDLSIGIEVNPYLTHSFYSKYNLLRDIPEEYHFKKFDFYIKKGIFIYNIWEEDYKNLSEIIKCIKNKDSINNENNYFSLGRDFIHKKDYLKKENAIQNLYRIKTIDNKILFQEDLKNIDKNNCKFIIKEVGTIKF